MRLRLGATVRARLPASHNSARRASSASADDEVERPVDVDGVLRRHHVRPQVAAVEAAVGEPLGPDDEHGRAVARVEQPPCPAAASAPRRRPGRAARPRAPSATRAGTGAAPRRRETTPSARRLEQRDRRVDVLGPAQRRGRLEQADRVERPGSAASACRTTSSIGVSSRRELRRAAEHLAPGGRGDLVVVGRDDDAGRASRPRAQPRPSRRAAASPPAARGSSPGCPSSRPAPGSGRARPR